MPCTPWIARQVEEEEEEDPDNPTNIEDFRDELAQMCANAIAQTESHRIAAPSVRCR